MGEVPGQFSPAQHAPRGAVYFAGRHARTNRRNGCLLRFEHRLIQPSSFTRRTSDVHSSRAIRAITGEYNTKIADHEPARECAHPRHGHAQSPSALRKRVWSETTCLRPRHNGPRIPWRRRLRPRSHRAESCCEQSETDWRLVRLPAGCAGSRPHPSPCGHARPAVARTAGAPSLSAQTPAGRACRR